MHTIPWGIMQMLDSASLLIEVWDIAGAAALSSRPAKEQVRVITTDKCTFDTDSLLPLDPALYQITSTHYWCTHTA